MTAYERAVLSHYNLSTAFPAEWPAEKDGAEDSDEAGSPNPELKSRSPLQRSKSRYSALEYLGTEGQTSFIRWDRTGPEHENPPRTDEPDPLGSSDSVVRLLRQRGLPVDDDAQLRNRYLLSSTTFSPALYLSQLHSNASTQWLLRSLDYLSRSIDQKSALLKHLVESNFERFVKVKATIDSVYAEMRGEEEESEKERRPLHSRHVSRSSNHFRNASGSGVGTSKASAATKKKILLVKETEYGVQDIKGPLIEVSANAEDLWGPVMGGVEREENLKAVLNMVEKYRSLFQSGRVIAECIKHREYDRLIEEYGRARQSAEEAKHVAHTAMNSGIVLTDSQIYQIVVTAQIWMDIDRQIDEFKRDVWRRLVGSQPSSPSTSTDVLETQSEEYMDLIGVLLELGVQDNPIWIWLLSRYGHLKSKITNTSARFKAEVEYFRRQLAANEQLNHVPAASRLHLALRQEPELKASNLDRPEVVHLWEGTYASLQMLVASQGGILGEVTDFWEVAQSFILGKTQRTLPVGFDGQSRKHHRLSMDGVRDLQNGVVELINMIRDSVLGFFLDPPPTDLSALSSASSAEASTRPKSGAPAQSAFRDDRLDVNAKDLPPPPHGGKFWEKFAFWPPHSNALSGVHYLGKILELVGTAAGDMIAIVPVNQANGSLERLRGLVAGARERSVQAICAAWITDAENCKILEDWSRSSGKNDITNMPSHFMTFQSNVLSGMQKILYISDAMTIKSGSADIVPAPPAKLLQLVRGQFVSSIYKALSGMVEMAEKPLPNEDDEWEGEADDVLASIGEVAAAAPAHGAKARDRNVRMLLTLNNLQALRTEVVPQLITQFETSFFVKLTEESKTIRDVLGQIDARLFHSYTRPSVVKLSRIIHGGILSPNWAPSGGRPSEVRPYVYEAMLSLVLVHAQVSTTAPSLTPQMLSYLLEQTSKELLEAFRQQQQPPPPAAPKKYSLAALMQATLDVEFVAQTLREYTTDKASDLQSQIYRELDRRTDHDARMMLQHELPEMRNILRALKERSRTEFACFKKPRLQQKAK